MAKTEEPALLTAVRARAVDGARKLVDEGAEVDAPGAGAQTALMWAARMGDLAMTRLLVDAGASLDVGDARGWTALAWAACEDQPDAVAALLEAGASPSASGSRALHVALLRGRGRIVELLVDAGADLSAVDMNERTPLEHAAYHGVPACVAAVLRGKVPRPSLDRALVAAAAEGHGKAVALLLDAGADTSFETARGNTALGIARKRRRKEVVALLVARGASLAKTATSKRAIPAPPKLRSRALDPAQAALVALLQSKAASKRRSAAKKIGASGGAAFEAVLLAALAHELEDVRAWEGQREMARALGALSSNAKVAAWLERVVVEARFESTVVPAALAGAALRIGHRAGAPELDRLLARVLDDVPAKDEKLAGCWGLLETAKEARLTVGPSIGRRIAAFLDDPGKLPRHGDVMLGHARKAWATVAKAR